MKPRNMPCVVTTCRTTSRAVHSGHGDGLSHLSSGTVATFAANASANRA